MRNFVNTYPIVFNLIAINIIMLGATYICTTRFGIDLYDILGMHFIYSEKFHIHQFFSYMFMHGGIDHLFFNMFAIFMFGLVFERIWGGRKFLFYYFISALGAALVQQTVWLIDYNSIVSSIDMESVKEVISNGSKVLSEGYNFSDKSLGQLNLLLNMPTVGASGAVFGVLLAFGYMFPDEKLFLFFIPIPIPARVFVIIYGVIELIAGVADFSGDNVAHFAHLGGLLFGLFAIWYWKRKGNLFNKEM